MGSFHSIYLLTPPNTGGTSGSLADIVAALKATDEFALIRTNLDAKVSSISGGSVELGELPAKVDSILTRINSIGTAKITVQNTVLPGGDIPLVRGSDYRIVDNRDLKITLEGSLYVQLLPRLSSIRLIVDKVSTLVVAATITPLTDSVLLQFELTAEQTRNLKFQRAPYYIEAITQDGGELPLGKGRVLVSGGGE